MGRLVWFDSNGNEIDEPICEMPKPKQTNADRIRSMTDEELAEALLEWFAALYDVEWTKENVLEVLKMESEDEDG